MKELLKNKNCVVTGAARGIGKAIALDYAKCGANVVITYVSSEKAARDTVDELLACGVKAFCFKCDCSNEQDDIRLAEFVKSELGTVDVLVNNAGTIGDECPVTDITSEQWDRVFDVDVKGVFLTIKYLLPLFNKSDVGKIINISSELSIKGRANYLAYTAAKGAVNAMTRSLALELAPDILVNTIAPGPIKTDMILKSMDEKWVKKEAEIPLNRLGDVSEISATAVLLASKYGNFYCGQFLSPNGGAVFN